MPWQTELVRIVRYLIDDLGTTPTYSDARLEETVLVAAQMTLRDVDFDTTYTIDVDELTLSPDPTVGTKDDAFINLVCLRAGCLIDSSTYRTKLREGHGVIIKHGASSIDTKGQLDAYKLLADKGLCQAYADAKWEYEAGAMSPGEAIIGPFSGESVHNHNYGSHRDRPTFH